MNAHTPSISVVDPRGLPVRAVAYFRQTAGESLNARVTHQFFDLVGRLIQQRDPRLFALSQKDASVPANLITIHSLTGQALCSDSVDAGWQLGLPGAAGQTLESWDQRGWHRRSEHDPLLRPVAVHEQVRDETERCVERLTWSGASDDHARHNRCGQPIRQDDPAGSRLLSDYGMSAAVLLEIRHFVNSFDSPDWPLVETERDRLLEPGEGAQSSWSFLPSGELSHQTDAKSHTRHFAYDRAGQLHSVGLQRAGQSTADTLVNAIEYNAFGQIEQERAGNGMRTSSGYDPANGRLTNLHTQGPAQGSLQKLSYRYDPVGNISEIADAALPIQYFANQRIEPVRRFVYDTLYQLISATGWETAKPSLGPALPEWQGFGPPDGSRWCNYSETYYYDEAGNLLQRLHHGAVDDTLTMRVASHSNRSIKTRSGQPGIDELFDARGNLLELQPGQALQWNGRNQLAQVTQVARVEYADDIERYVYDSEGARLRKYREITAKSIVHSAEVRYLPGIELHANSATGEQLQVIRVQVGRCTVRLLHWESPPPTGLDNDQWRYCFDDHLGSSAFEVDVQAKTISQEVYYPFGGTAWLAGRHEVETSYKIIRYSGKERDTTGLYYYGARYYAPWLQRWLNADPAGDVDGLNFYRFVRNSPAVYVDQKGRFSIPAYISKFLFEISNFLFERNNDVTERIEQRGMDDIRMYMPEVAKNLDEAFQELKSILTYAIAELEGNNLDKSAFEVYFGIKQVAQKDIDYFSSGYRELLMDIAHVSSHPNRLVAYTEGKQAAFVLLDDSERKIYFNSRVFARGETEINALSLGHELTHLSQVFKSLDYWYIPEHTAIMPGEVYSYHVFHDRNFPVVNFEMMNGVDFVPETGAPDLEQAVQIFKHDMSLRTSMARRNADTLMSFAKALSGEIRVRNP